MRLGSIAMLIATPAAAADFAYVANLRAGTLSVLDTATPEVVARIGVGVEPDGLAVSPDGREVWVANFTSNTISIVDVATRNVVATVEVGAGPIGVAFRPNSAEVWVTNKNASTISIVDAGTRTVVDGMPLTPNSGPNSIAFTGDGARAYVTESRRTVVAVIDATARSVVVDAAAGISPNRVVIDPVRNRAYVSNYQSADISVFDTEATQLIGSIPKLSDPLREYMVKPLGLSLNPDGTRLYIAVPAGALVADPGSRQLLELIPVPNDVSGTSSVALTVVGDSGFLAMLESAAVIGFDSTSAMVDSTTCVDAGPFAIETGDYAATQAAAWITSPLSGTKVAPESALEVRGTVHGGSAAAQSWQVLLRQAGGPTNEIGAGTGDRTDALLATVPAGTLVAGETYAIELAIVDGASITRRSSVDVTAPDPRFAVVPVNGGNDLWATGGVLVDGAGEHALYIADGYSPQNLAYQEIISGVSREVFLESYQGPYLLSADSSTLVYSRNLGDTLSFQDLIHNDDVPSAVTDAEEVDIDRTGQRVVFIKPVLDNDQDNDHDVRFRRQYFYYDQTLLELRQLTTVPGTINRVQDPYGYAPQISGDGKTIAYTSHLVLFDAPPGDTALWRIYRYDVETRETHFVAVLEKGQTFATPAISDDGVLLSFVTTRPGTPTLSTSALLNLRTGEIEEPIAGVDDFPTYTALVTADGKGVVLGTTADLDPAVGNADHNSELYLYDRESQEITQLTQTIGEAQPTPGLPSPSISDTGETFGLWLNRGSVYAACPAAGPQRDEMTGLYLGRVFSVPKQAGNQPPELEHVDDARFPVGTDSAVVFNATDPDGDRFVFFLQLKDGISLPGNAVIETPNAPTARLFWVPSLQDIGTYEFRVGVFDVAGGVTTQDYTVQVCYAFDQQGNCLPPPTETPTPIDTPTATITQTRTPLRTHTPTITRTASPTSTGVATSTATSTSTVPATATATAGTSGGGGGGCQVGDASKPGTPWMLALLVLPLLRRRRGAYSTDC